MIDERKLILHLNDWMLQESFLRHMKNPADTIDECIKAVEEQPKIGGWIPCSERLPEEDKDVLIYTPYDGIDIAYISDENWRYSRGDDFIETVEKANVLAWQPLPEAYHE